MVESPVAAGDGFFVPRFTKISERNSTMAKCETCGKTTTFGHNRSFSMRATNRTYRPALPGPPLRAPPLPLRSLRHRPWRLSPSQHHGRLFLRH